MFLESDGRTRSDAADKPIVATGIRACRKSSDTVCWWSRRMSCR